MPITEFPIDTVNINDAESLRLDGYVSKTGNETIADIKTFTSSPVVPVPTTNLQAANKQYVDEFGGRLKCIEFTNAADDSNPHSIDLGVFYPDDTDLGDCLYECWQKLLATGPGGYDWSDGYGAAHAMLRNCVTGNVGRGGVVTNATNATPIVVTTEKVHNLTTGAGRIDRIRGVLGNTAANVSNPTITVLSTTTFSIDGSVGNGAYVSGGFVINTPVTGSGLVSFGADDVPYEGQWSHSATGIVDDIITQYYDGVPVGIVPFTGARFCAGGEFGSGHGFIGGSDHSGIRARIAQYRVFEDFNPYDNGLTGIGIGQNVFQPETVFGSGSGGTIGTRNASFLCDMFNVEQILTDKSAGFPEGRTHAGKIRGTGASVVSNRSSYPGPQYVTDADIPNALGLVATPQPAGRVYTPVTPPAGAIVFDSIERKNATYAFDGIGGMGSTESGSAGPLVWNNPLRAGGLYYFGILNEQFIYMAPSEEKIAWVPCGSANVEVKSSRKVSPSYRCGVSTGIAFRRVDASNFCVAVTYGDNITNQSLILLKIVAGVVTAMTGNGTACPATAWETLRVKTKADGTYEVLCDATSLVSDTAASNAAGTGQGIAQYGVLPYGVGQWGGGIRLRYRNFTVLPNP